MDVREQWAHIVSAAQQPRPAAERESALRTAVLLGTAIVPAAVGCSVTERVGPAYRTVLSANPLSTALDEAQYAAGGGPCMAAADDGTVHRIDSMAADQRFPGFTAAAVRRGVRSSLSVPLPDPRRPAALNFYGGVERAFPDGPAPAADLLARCVAALLPGPAADPAPELPDLAAVRSRRVRVERALELLGAARGLGRPAAFAELARRSRDTGRSLHAVVDELLDRAATR